MEEPLKHKDPYEDLYENAPDMYVLVDAATATINRCNQALVTSTGYSKAELIGRSVFEMYHPDCRAKLEETFELFLKTGEIPYAELQLQCKNGCTIDVGLKASALRDPQGKVLYSRSILRDVSDLKRTQALLEESEVRSRIMADCAPVALWMAGADAKCTFFNQGWLSFTGRSMEQELGEGWTEGIHPLDFQNYVDTYISAFNARREFRMEYRLQRADGEYRWVLDHGAPRYAPDGHFVGYVGSCIDITDRKTTEEHIKASLREKDVLLKEIHHRVKNNLQVISSLLKLQSRKLHEKHVVEMLLESQNRILAMSLIHEILYQSGNLAKIDFGRYAQMLVENLFRSFGADRRRLAPHIRADGVSLGPDSVISCGLIINELISNSLKHAFPPGSEGEIRIDLRPWEDQKFRLTVSDTGKGFPKDLDFRNTPSLGLQLVNILTDQLGGTLELQNAGGTTFTIIFTERKYMERY